MAPNDQKWPNKAHTLCYRAQNGQKLLKWPKSPKMAENVPNFNSLIGQKMVTK